jgi:perosamine synthetase
MHLQPAFRSFSWFKEEDLPVSEKLYNYGFYLPSGLTLSEDNIRKVAGALKEIL